MQREKVLRALALEREIKRRRQASRLKSYNTGPVHLKQTEFHKSSKRNRWVFGGNRSGKTECGAAETVYLARGCHPYRANKEGASGWVVSVSQQVQRDVAQAKILSYIDPAWIEDVVMLSGSKSSPKLTLRLPTGMYCHSVISALRCPSDRPRSEKK